MLKRPMGPQKIAAVAATVLDLTKLSSFRQLSAILIVGTTLRHCGVDRAQRVRRAFMRNYLQGKMPRLIRLSSTGTRTPVRRLVRP